MEPKTPIVVKKSNRTCESHISIPPSPFLKRLGYGTGINVWKLDRSPKVGIPRSPWAVKKVLSVANEKVRKKAEGFMEKEANILKDLHHDNIVGFRGFTKAVDGKRCLLLENCEKSLGDMIEAKNEDDPTPYTSDKILKVGLALAKALDYLHNEKRIIHGDIKSYNVLINGDFDNIKLCDFGASCLLNESGIASGFIGTPIYSAPECQEGAEGPITCKSDIFSFGLVLWEMIALSVPHIPNEDISLDSSVESMADDGIDESVFGKRPPIPSVDLGEEYNPVLELFHCCTEQDPTKRPSAKEIVKYLEEVIETRKDGEAIDV